MCIRDSTGPYKVNRVLGDATYELTECDSSRKVRGNFNVRLLKKYYETKIPVSYTHLDVYKRQGRDNVARINGLYE